MRLITGLKRDEESVIAVMTVSDGQKKKSQLPSCLPHLESAKSLSTNWVRKHPLLCVYLRNE